ncbi:MAG: hypothetical protein P8N54_07190, partial [Flavobacteriales bacterium]|nr:hypothetical protein [Flavobacteriales bacterium]
SIFDIVSSDKGMLIPRLDIVDLSTIDPVTDGSTEGLFVYNTNTSTGKGFYYWDGSSWISIFDGSTGSISIKEESDLWYVAVDDQSSSGDSDFYISTASNASDSYFRITRSGNISIGDDENSPRDILHITKDQEATTAIRLDNTLQDTDVAHTALELFDGSDLEAFFRHNNNTDILELGNNDNTGEVDMYAGGGVVMNLDQNRDVNVSNNLKVSGQSEAQSFKLSALNTAPASASDTGTLGEIRIVNGFIYVCVATDTWQRAALSTF